MSEEFQFQFDGVDSRAAAEELAAFLQNDFADWQPRAEEQKSAIEGRKSGDTLAVLAVILSVPGAILATWDIAVRINLKTKIDRVIEWGQERAARGEEVPRIVFPDGSAVPLDQAKTADILNALDEASKKPRW